MQVLLATKQHPDLYWPLFNTSVINMCVKEKRSAFIKSPFLIAYFLCF